jgi:hypothetical protein
MMATFQEFLAVTQKELNRHLDRMVGHVPLKPVNRPPQRVVPPLPARALNFSGIGRAPLIPDDTSTDNAPVTRRGR